MSLSPLYGSPVRHVVGAITKERSRALATPVAPVDTTRNVQPAPAAAPPRVEELTVDAARALSIDTINLLVREKPGLVARMVIDAGRRRRGELPMSRSELRPAALAVILCGMKRRAEPLTDADEFFLASYLEELDAS